jgi:hypothetical protein
MSECVIRARGKAEGEFVSCFNKRKYKYRVPDLPHPL